MKQFHTSLQKFVIFLMLFTIGSMAAIAQAPQQKTPPGTSQTAAKVDRLLKEAGLNSKKFSEQAWLVAANGKEFPVLIAAWGDVIVVGVVLAKKDAMPMSKEFLFKLLKLNHEYDFVKIGFDSDDDLFARTERKASAVTATDFKETFDQVVNASAEALSQIKPFLK